MLELKPTLASQRERYEASVDLILALGGDWSV
jgi:hypothetical protein